MPGPGVTIETYLEKIKNQDIKTVQQQMDTIAKTATGSAKKIVAGNKQTDVSMAQLEKRYSTHGRAMVMQNVRVKIATHQLKDWREGMIASNLIMRDSITRVGLMNTALNIMISRFGSMVIVFFLFRMMVKWNEAMKEATETIDTMVRKVASLVVPSTNLADAVTTLTVDMIKFATELGGSFDQLGDTIFFLASAGLKSAEIHEHFVSVQKLVIATSKDLNATLTDNKQIVETAAAILINFSDSLDEVAEGEAKTAYLAAIVFDAFRRNQILLTELASGMTYAAAEGRTMGVSIVELIYILANANTAFLKGSKAGTSFANAMSDTIKKATLINKLFDVDMSKVGEDWSFLETVIKPVADRLKETGSNQQLLTDVQTVWGKRGKKLILALIPLYQRIHDQINTTTDRQKAFNDAVDIATGSYKNQRQIFKNLWTIIANFFAIGITGGRGYNSILTDINEQLRAFLKIFAAIGGLMSGWSATMQSIGRLVFALVHWLRNLGEVAGQTAEFLVRIPRAMLGGADSMDALVSEYDKLFKNIYRDANENWKSAWADMKGYYKGAGFLFKIATGDYDSFNEVLSKTKDILDQNTAAVEDFVGTMEGLNAISKARLAILDQEYVVLNKMGERAKLLSDEAKDITFAGAVERFNITKDKGWLVNLDEYKDLVSGLYDASNVDNFFEKLTEGWTIQKKDMSIFVEESNKKFREMALQLGLEFDEAWTKATTQGGTLGKKPLEVLAEYWEKYQLIVNKYVIGVRESESKFLQTQLDMYSKQSDVLVAEFKDRYGRFARVISTGQTLYELKPEDILNLKFDDIDFSGDILPAFRAKLEDAVKTASKVTLKGAKIDLSEQIKLSGPAGADIGKAFKDRAIDDFKNKFEFIITVIQAKFDSLRSSAYLDLQDTVRQLTKNADEARVVIDSIIDGSKVKNETQQMKDFWSAVGVDKRQAIDALASVIRGLDKAQSNMISNLESIGQGKVRDGLAILVEWLRKLKDEAAVAVEVLNQKWKSVGDTLGNVASTISDMGVIIGNSTESSARKVTALISQSISGVSRLLDVYTDYQKRMKVIESLGAAGAGLAAGAQLAAATGGLSAAISIAAGIITLLRSGKEEKRDLQAEFLPDDAGKRISPDYGQAKTIYQKVSLSNMFQWLDPSQLSIRVQKDITMMVFNGLKELQETEG